MVFKDVFLAKQQIPEKPVEVFRRGVNAELVVVVICPYQCVSEIPRIFGKQIIVDRKTEHAQILDRKNGGRACVALAKRMDLPNARNEFRDMLRRLLFGQRFVAECLFLLKVVHERRPYTARARVVNGFAIQHPLVLGNSAKAVSLSPTPSTFRQLFPTTLSLIEKMPETTFDEILDKYIKMNVAHPFMEGNGRTTRIWLDLMLKRALKKCVDWSVIEKNAYLEAMRISVSDSTPLKALVRTALTNKINDRETFMKGIDYSYYYEEPDQ